MDMAGSVVPTFGDIHVVVSTSDVADYNYQKLSEVFQPSNGFVRFWTSLNDAYDACNSNNDDVILLDAHSTHSITPIAWTKNRIHVIGMDGGERLLQQGSKVQSATTGTTSYVVKVTGVRNTFRNVKFIQASTQSTALTVIEDGSEGTLWKNCSAVFGVTTNLGLTTAHEFLAGSDSATFKECTFGCDTLLTSAARSVFHIDQVNGFEFKSNQLIDCTFSISSSNAGATFVKLDAVGDILFSNIFKRCTFGASVDSAGGIALTVASFTGTSTVKGCLIYDQCAVFNCADFATATSGGNAATQVLASSPTAGSAGIGVQPTA